MSRIKVMVNGIPGNVSRVVARHFKNDDRFLLLPFSLTGPEITESRVLLDDKAMELIKPDARDQKINDIKSAEGDFIIVDYTHPTAVNDNANFYCANRLFFVMGTTGGDRELLDQTVQASSISAVIAPNMAKQVVGFQAMMEYMAGNFPDLFKGYTLEIKESHQKGKADTSGTAKSMVKYFNAMGLAYSENDIIKERDPKVQNKTWGIPEEFLGGHGWHTYTLVSDDKTVRFEFSHNINGREIYGGGTLDSVLYLKEKAAAGSRGEVFTMLDVLKGS